MNVTIEIGFILVLILANGLFALAEIAVVSARKVRLQKRAEDGDARARAALELANDPGHFLSTVQVGITLIGVLAGAFGGATIAEELAAQLDGFPWLARYSEAVAVGIVVLAITYLSVVLGEVLPKRLALHNPERAAATVAPLMRLCAKIGTPVVWLLNVSSEALLRLLRLRPPTEPAITDEEISILIEQGTAAGAFQKAEKDMVERVFRLADLPVSALLTPRPQIEWLDVDDPPPEQQRKLAGCAHARLPVAQGSLDNVLGVVRAKDALARLVDGQALDLKSIVLPASVVPETMPALKLLEQFKRTRPHLAMVVDEYGGVQGLVTLNDVLEVIVGNLPPRDREAHPQAIQRPDGSWLTDGSLPISEFKELLGIKKLPHAGDCHTVGGLVVTQLGHLPAAGESCEWNGYRFEVMDMDGRRVDKVLVTKPEEDP